MIHIQKKTVFFLGGGRLCTIHLNNHWLNSGKKHPDASAELIAGFDASASTIGLDIGQGNQNLFLLQQWTSNCGKRLGFSGFAMFMSPFLGCVVFMIHSSFFGLKMREEMVDFGPRRYILWTKNLWTKSIEDLANMAPYGIYGPWFIWESAPPPIYSVATSAEVTPNDTLVGEPPKPPPIQA